MPISYGDWAKRVAAWSNGAGKTDSDLAATNAGNDYGAYAQVMAKKMIAETGGYEALSPALRKYYENRIAPMAYIGGLMKKFGDTGSTDVGAAGNWFPQTLASMVAPTSAIRAGTPGTPGTGGTASSYTVKNGDWLSKIARDQWGGQYSWKDVYDKNKGAIGNNPNLIHPGEVYSMTTGGSGGTPGTPGGYDFSKVGMGAMDAGKIFSNFLAQYDKQAKAGTGELNAMDSNQLLAMYSWLQSMNQSPFASKISSQYLSDRADLWDNTMDVSKYGSNFHDFLKLAGLYT